MSVTPEKQHTRKIIAAIVYSSTKHQPILIKIPKLVNKTDHEESEATETDNSNYDKATEHTEDKESP